MLENSPLSRLSASAVVTASCLLGLLYFGRDVLQPIALASILSLAIAPLVRRFRRSGLPRMAATLVSVMLVGMCVVGLSTILAYQLVAVAGDMPKYRAAITTKVDSLRALTERPFALIQAELSAVSPAPPAPAPTRRGAALAANPNQPIPVEIRAPRVTTRDAIARAFALAWGPVGSAGVVLVLLVFILLEHESLRDRLIRLAGQGETRRTIKALSDATTGVSRFFFSQFIVNVTFGALIGLSLWAAGVPHAALWGVLSGLLRFVPYLGILLAGAVIALFVAAIDPGWKLALSCMSLFVALEMIVANFVEPKVYGQSSGMSPLAIIVSALFWAAIWGPVGLLLSTPLTLCLVVAGRHVRSLELVTTLLGDTPSVNAAERLYQRFLVGDTNAIISDARAFLRQCSFARYCDQILLPGLALSAADTREGNIDQAQEERVRLGIADVAAALTPVSSAPARRQRRRDVSLLDTNVGAHLRRMREARLGQWQGSLDVPVHSIVLCCGLRSARDDLLMELLVRALREVSVDARSVTVGSEDAPGEDTPGLDKADLVSSVFLAYPTDATLEAWRKAAIELRVALPDALFVTIRLPFDERAAHPGGVEDYVDMILRSYEEGLAFVSQEKPAAD
ncbi:AI-2E family transporter [Massilia sp. S19_KUP03_FR1]|uniref:AI-2E family transporter n=1 Tax=Massilia sp. S19_KUP03_FR1 TaxID=3025503 RepID=UPI002FCDA27F